VEQHLGIGDEEVGGAALLGVHGVRGGELEHSRSGHGRGACSGGDDSAGATVAASGWGSFLVGGAGGGMASRDLWGRVRLGHGLGGKGGTVGVGGGSVVIHGVAAIVFALE